MGPAFLFRSLVISIVLTELNNSMSAISYLSSSFFGLDFSTSSFFDLDLDLYDSLDLDLYDSLDLKFSLLGIGSSPFRPISLMLTF